MADRRARPAARRSALGLQDDPMPIILGVIEEHMEGQDNRLDHLDETVWKNQVSALTLKVNALEGQVAALRRRSQRLDSWTWGLLAGLIVTLVAAVLGWWNPHP